MRRRLAAGLIVVLAAAGAAAPAGAYGVVGKLVAVAVTPAKPAAATTVTVSFRLPGVTTGPVSPAVVGLARTDVVAVAGPTGRKGCVDAGSANVPKAAAGSTVHVSLRPSALGGRWCVGAFSGTITQSAEPSCPPTPDVMCPQYMTVPVIIGRFHFTVTAR